MIPHVLIAHPSPSPSRSGLRVSTWGRQRLLELKSGCRTCKALDVLTGRFVV